jgi:hypothetical protein
MIHKRVDLEHAIAQMPGITAYAILEKLHDFSPLDLSLSAVCKP